jgi:hypothetical protein
MKEATPPKKPTQPPCRHPVLYFEDGGLHVVCRECKQAWQAINKERLLPDFMARGQGLTDLDVRRDPYAPYP